MSLPGSPIGVPGLPDFTIQASDIGPPNSPTDIPREHLQEYFRDTYTELRSMNVPGLAASIIAGLVVVPCLALVVAKDIVLVLLKVVLPAWGGQVLNSLDDLRKALDPE